MRRLLAALVMLLAALGTHAEERRYAVLSLLSDQLTVVVRGERVTGSNIDHNRRQGLAIPGHILDKRMVLAIDDALRSSGAAAAPVLLFTTDPAIFERQASLLDAGAGTASLLDAVKPVLKGVDARYLVLATKYRHDATLQVENGSLGTGVLSGLGFYVDNQMDARRESDGRMGVGFVAAYAYFMLSLIDLQTGQVVREVPVMGSQFALGYRSETGNPWDAMTPQEKIAALERLLKSETRRAMPQLVAQ